MLFVKPLSENITSSSSLLSAHCLNMRYRHYATQHPSPTAVSYTRSASAPHPPDTCPSFLHSSTPSILQRSPQARLSWPLCTPPGVPTITPWPPWWWRPPRWSWPEPWAAPAPTLPPSAQPRETTTSPKRCTASSTSPPPWVTP